MTAVTFADIHTFARAGSAARYWRADGTLGTTSADEPRIAYSPVTGLLSGLLIEDAATNLISNPDWAGVVAGTPGTNPTGHDFVASAGVTRELIGVTTEDGMDVFTIRWYASSPAGSNNTLRLNGSGGFPCTNGQVARLGWHAALVAGGNTAGCSFRAYMQDGGTVGGVTGFTPTTAALRTQPFAISRTGATGGMSFMTANIGFLPTSATPFDFQMKIAMPMVTINQALTTWVEGTRAQETCVRPLGGEWTASAWTMGVGATAPVAAPTGQAKIIWQIDDGTNSNALRLYIAAGTSSLRLGVIVGGVETTMTIGTITAGTAFACIIGGSDGSYGASLNQLAAVTLTAAQPTGLTTLRWGHDATPGQYLNGTIEDLRLSRGRVLDDNLPAVVFP
jgi:hypothetical protein